MNEEVMRQLLKLLWQRHVAAEQQYLWWILGAPLLALFIFLILWWKHRGHAASLVEAISFFFAPRGPEKMLVFKDLAGNQYLIYDYRVLKGEKGYTVQAGPFILRCSVDPESYAEAVSLIDARGPPGVPSPFGLLVRQLISSYIMVALIALAFVNTFYTTWDPYMRHSGLIGGVTWTGIDLLALSALVISIAWLIAVLLRVTSPQTMIVHLSAIGAGEGFLEASPGLDVYSSYPPAMLLRSIGREVKVVVSDSLQETVQKLEEEVGDRGLAASLLALLGQVYDTWRRSLGILLQDRYDISVAARARYQLAEEKLPRGFLSKYAGVLALVAIVGMIVLAALWLQPSLGPAASNATTNATLPHPAQPPQPPVTPS